MKNTSNLPVYHKTRTATYLDNGDGSLTTVYHGKQTVEKTILRVKNDRQGEEFLKMWKLSNRRSVSPVTTYQLYRCPVGGKKYDEVTNPHVRISSTCRRFFLSRRGSISKKNALVICLLKK